MGLSRLTAAFFFCVIHLIHSCITSSTTTICSGTTDVTLTHTLLCFIRPLTHTRMPVMLLHVNPLNVIHGLFDVSCTTTLSSIPLCGLLPLPVTSHPITPTPYWRMIWAVLYFRHMPDCRLPAAFILRVLSRINPCFSLKLSATLFGLACATSTCTTTTNSATSTVVCPRTTSGASAKMPPTARTLSALSVTSLNSAMTAIGLLLRWCFEPSTDGFHFCCSFISFNYVI